MWRSAWIAQSNAAATGPSTRVAIGPRQHTVSVYRKPGLAGRAELAAFSLEDLLLPMDLDGEQEAPPLQDPTGGSRVTHGS